MAKVTIPIGPQHPALKEPECFSITLNGERIVEMDMRIAFTCDINSEDETQVFVRWNHGTLDCTELAAIQMQLNMMRWQALAIQDWINSDNFIATRLPALWNFIGRKRHERYFDIEALLKECISEQ